MELSQAESQNSNLWYYLQEAKREIAKLKEAEKARTEKEIEDQNRKGILDLDNFYNG